MRLPSTQLSDRERFLAAVAEQVPVDRVVELYLFQPIRQGGVESGVAIIAAAADATADATSEAAEAPPPDVSARGPQAADVPADVEHAASDGTAGPSPGEPRYTVFTARYRHVLKGPERGRWEVSVVAEADAPLATVAAVVRGVQRRAGDVEPPDHITGDALRDALASRSAARP